MTGAAPAPEHARLPPSGAPIWAPEDGCRGSVAMQEKYPEPEDSDEAREGTAAHHYAAELLNGRDVIAGAAAPNGVPINAEMVDCAQALLVDVRDTLRSIPGALLYVEQRVYMTRHIGLDCWGTPDVVILDVPGKRLLIWDYKYGHGYVAAGRNWQLICYAIGALETAGIYADEGRGWLDWTITVTIAQPRNYHSSGPIREAVFSGSTLQNRYLPQVRQAAEETRLPEPPLRTGDHCLHCTARHACPALQRSGALSVDVSLRSQPIDLPPHAVGLELRMLEDAAKRIEARKTGLQEHALGLIRGGTLVPFFSTEYASGRERFVASPAEVFALGDMLGADLRKPVEAITPGQARTALKKIGIDEAVISAYAEKPRGALRLVRVDDNAASLAFQQE